MKMNLELSEALVARIDAIASIQKTTREMSVLAALQAWYAHPRTVGVGDLQIYRSGPEGLHAFKEYHPDTQRELLGDRLP